MTALPSVIYTVGHSNRSAVSFVSLLESAAVGVLVDVRRHPVSERYPHFSEDSLRDLLGDVGITYHWAGRQLGGRREGRADSVHTGLGDAGMRAYADYMDTEAFQKAAAQLVSLAARAPTAIMCAERLPEHCHRNLIADYLLLQGIQVLHLVDDATVMEHRLHPAARRESVQLIYDGQADWISGD